jgi:hypothetical protein
MIHLCIMMTIKINNKLLLIIIIKRKKLEDVDINITFILLLINQLLLL